MRALHFRIISFSAFYQFCLGSLRSKKAAWASTQASLIFKNFRQIVTGTGDNCCQKWRQIDAGNSDYSCTKWRQCGRPIIRNQNVLDTTKTIYQPIQPQYLVQNSQITNSVLQFIINKLNLVYHMLKKLKQLLRPTTTGIDTTTTYRKTARNREFLA